MFCFVGCCGSLTITPSVLVSQDLNSNCESDWISVTPKFANWGSLKKKKHHQMVGVLSESFCCCFLGFFWQKLLTKQNIYHFATKYLLIQILIDAAKRYFTVFLRTFTEKIQDSQTRPFFFFFLLGGGIKLCSSSSSSYKCAVALRWIFIVSNKK